LSAFNSFCDGAARGKFPQLNDRDELWRLLVVITARKAMAQANRNARQKRGGGRVVSEVVLFGREGAWGTWVHRWTAEEGRHAIAIRDYERGAHPSLSVGVGTVVFLGLFHHDFHELPEKAYQAYAVTGPTFPESFKDHALELWTLALIGFAGIAFLTWIERDPKREPFDPVRYAKVLRSLREAFDGLLVLSFFALVAGASLAGLVLFIGVRTHAALDDVAIPANDGVPLRAWTFIPQGGNGNAVILL